MGTVIKRHKANYFNNGGFSWNKNLTFGNNIANMIKDKAISQAIGAAGGGLLSGGVSTGVGNTLRAVGSLAGMLDPTIGLGINLGGSLINGAFGSDINYANVDALRNTNTTQSNMQFTGSTVEDMLGQSNFNLLGNISKSQVGKDGLFSSKASNYTKSLNKERDLANQQAIYNYNLAVNNMLANNNLNATRNSFADGGSKTDNKSILSAINSFFNLFKSDDNSNNYPNPIFNPYYKKWFRSGKQLKKRYEKPFGYTEYTNDGFAVNYNNKGHELSRKKGTQTPYISGSRNKQEQKYFDIDKEYTDSVKAISKRYGLNPNLVASRLSREGIDAAVKMYNESGGRKLLSHNVGEHIGYDYIPKYGLVKTHDDFLGGPLWGLDWLHDDIQRGDVKIKEPNFTYKNARFINEHGTPTNTGMFTKWNDVISATAAELASRRDAMKQVFPNANDMQLDAAASGAFNLGIPTAKQKGLNYLVKNYKPFINLKANGGPFKKRKSYDDWYKTVPADRNDTTLYNLRRAYELAPMSELEAWRTSSTKDLEAGRNHLRTVYRDPKTGIYEFMKSKNHPTINMELDWYNGNTPDAVDFRNQYNLDTSGDYYRYIPKKAFGGPLHTHGADWTNGITIIDNGGTHEENPYGGVQSGVDEQGIPNLLEEGEVVYDDYVFSNRLVVPSEVRNKYRFRGNKDLTFADAAKQVHKESEERPNDPISANGLEVMMYNLAMEQEMIRNKKNKNRINNRYDSGGYKRGLNLKYEPLDLINTYKNVTGLNSLQPKLPDLNVNRNNNDDSNLSWLRYMPVVGNVLGVTQSLLNKPDYSSSDTMMNEAASLGSYTPVEAKVPSYYLPYTPADRNYYATKLMNQVAATKRGIVNQSLGNRASAMQGLMAADIATLSKMSDLYRQADDYNNNQRLQAATFNRATDQFGSELAMKTATTNAELAAKARLSRLEALSKAIAAREAVNARREAAINANISGLFNNLGNIGVDEFERERANRVYNYKTGRSGKINYYNE